MIEQQGAEHGGRAARPAERRECQRRRDDHDQECVDRSATSPRRCRGSAHVPRGAGATGIGRSPRAASGRSPGPITCADPGVRPSPSILAQRYPALSALPQPELHRGHRRRHPGRIADDTGRLRQLAGGPGQRGRTRSEQPSCTGRSDGRSRAATMNLDSRCPRISQVTSLSDGQPVVAPGRQHAVAPPVQPDPVDDLHGVRLSLRPDCAADVHRDRARLVAW